VLIVFEPALFSAGCASPFSCVFLHTMDTRLLMLDIFTGMATLQELGF